ncbi:MAG: complex I NDUFA9 subunit family protein [Candidatus Glassbacteria bacterium]
MILVTGGTGFIGSEVVRKLVASGREVRVMSRNPEKALRLFEDMKVELVGGSVTDAESLELAMKGTETVINCVQFENYPMEKKSKGLTFMDVDGKGTVNQVTTAVRAGVREFIYVSGAGAGKSREEKWFKAKNRAEESVRDSSLDYLIIRPTWVYGPRDRSVNRFVSFAKKLPFVPLIGDGNQKVQPLYVGDLAEIICHIVDTYTGRGRTYEVGGPHVFTMRRLVEIVLEVLGVSKPIIPIPVPLMRFASVIAKFFPGSTISPEVIDFAIQEAVVDNSRILETFPITLKSFEEVLKQYAC